MLKLDKDFRICPAFNSNNHKQIHDIIRRLNALTPGSNPNITPIHYLEGTIDWLVHIFKMGQNRLNLDPLPEQEQKQSNPKLVITTLMDPQKTASSMWSGCLLSFLLDGRFRFCKCNLCCLHLFKPGLLLFNKITLITSFKLLHLF